MAGARITFGSKQYVLRDQLVIQQISEFNTAIRQGAPSNDDRNLASFLSYEDPRGGIGTVFGVVREDPDKLADSDGLIALKMNQVIKPPRMYERTASGLTLAANTRAVFYEPPGDGVVMLGYGRLVYYNGVAGETVTWSENNLTVLSADKHISQFLSYRDPEDGEERIYIASEEGEDLEYISAHDASSATVVTAVAAEMLFTFDGKLFAGGPGELKWSIRPSDSAQWNEMNAGIGGDGAWPNRWKFVGVFPYGETYWPYVLIEHDNPESCRLAAVELDNNRVVPLTLGLGDIVDAFAHQGRICVIHDNGREATVVDPRFLAQLPMDWRAEARDGFVAERDGTALGGVTHPRGAVFLSSLSASEHGQLFLHKGTGWVPYGRKVAGVPVAALYYSSREQRFYFAYEADGATDLSVADIKWFSEAFTPGEDQSIQLEPEDMSFIVPWFDMGFSEIGGVLLTMGHGGYADASNQVRVEYQLDYDTSEWLLLGTYPGATPGEPEITGRTRAVQNDRTLLFNTLSGVAFTRARFKFTLITSGETTMQSPNAYPLTVRFLKRPDLRDSIRIAIDVDETLAMRDDVRDLDELWLELKALYDQRVVPKLVAGPVTTWMAIIALPRVIDIEPEGQDDIVPSTKTKELTIVLNVAELL